MRKKLLALSLVAIMAFAMILPMTAFAASGFTDIDDSWAAPLIEKWADLNVLNGTGDGMFKPEDQMTRASFFKVVDAIFAFQTAVKTPFNDNVAGAWYYDVVERVYAAGIVQGDGTSVNPNSYITRQEAFTILARVFNVTPDESGLSKFADADSVASWAKGAVGGLAALGYVNGFDGLVQPKANISRAEVVQVVDNIVAALYSTAGTYTDDVNGIAIVNTKDVVLDGITVKGDLYVAQGVGDGDFTLKDSKVEGALYVNGGGANSIKIEGSDVGSVVIFVDSSTGEVRISVSGNSNIAVVYVNDGSDDVILDGAFTNVVIEGNSNITVAVGSTIESISVKGDNSEIAVAAGATVKEVTVDASAVTISGAGTVTQVTVVSGEGNVVTVPGAKVVVSEDAGAVDLGNGKTVESGKSDTVVEETPGTGGGGGVVPPSSATPTSIAIATTTSVSQTVTATVSSLAISINMGQTATLTSILGPSTANNAVAWTVSGNCNFATATSLAQTTISNSIVGASCVTITPTASGSITVTVTSLADPNKYATITINVNP